MKLCPLPIQQNHHAQILKENLAMNIEEILKGTSLKNRNESLLIKSTIELLHKKNTLFILESLQNKIKCLNENILHKYQYYFPQVLK